MELTLISNQHAISCIVCTCQSNLGSTSLCVILCFLISIVISDYRLTKFGITGEIIVTIVLSGTHKILISIITLIIIILIMLLYWFWWLTLIIMLVVVNSKSLNTRLISIVISGTLQVNDQFLEAWFCKILIYDSMQCMYSYIRRDVWIHGLKETLGGEHPISST